MADTRVCDDPSLPKPRKSTFKITSVTKSTRGGSGEIQADADGDVDSMDDLDESHTEDFSSEVLDSSKATDIDQDVALTPEEIFTKDNRPADPQSRFRVVKIETKEPFRRGRWLCHDFLDTPAERAEIKHTDEIHVHSGTSSASSSIHYVHGVDDPSRNPLAAGAVGTVHHADTRPGNFSPKLGETFKPIHPAPKASQASAMPVTPIPPQRQPTSSVDTTMQNQNHNLPQSQHIGSNIQQGNIQKQQPMHIPVATHNVIQQVPQAQMTVPTSIPQNTVHTANVQPHQGQTIGQNVNVHASSGNVMHPQSLDAHSSQPANFPTRTPVPVAEQIPQAQGVPGGTIVQIGAQNPLAAPRYGQVNQPGAHSINTNTAPVQPLQNHVPNVDNQLDNTVHSQGQDSSQTSQQQITHVQETNQVQRPGSIPIAGDDSSKDLPRDLGNETNTSQTLLSPLAAAVGSMTNQPADEIRDDSGSSTVAIDNKIEQAMDLVKSHLMFAVREEVEVLKEQIKELMEKIGQLEYENGVLKANATQETLSKLNPPKQQPPSSSS